MRNLIRGLNLIMSQSIHQDQKLRLRAKASSRNTHFSCPSQQNKFLKTKSSDWGRTSQEEKTFLTCIIKFYRVVYFKTKLTLYPHNLCILPHNLCILRPCPGKLKRNKRQENLRKYVNLPGFSNNLVFSLWVDWPACPSARMRTSRKVRWIFFIPPN